MPNRNTRNRSHVTHAEVVAAYTDDRDSELLDAVITAAALVARADGWIEPAERAMGFCRYFRAPKFLTPSSAEFVNSKKSAAPKWRSAVLDGCGALAGAPGYRRWPGNRGRRSASRSSRAAYLAADPNHAGPASRGGCFVTGGIVNGATGIESAARPAMDAAARRREQRLERLIGRLPRNLQSMVRCLRRPWSRWVRISGGILLIGGSVLSILPLFGLWMLPLGLVLLAEDVPLLRRARDRILDWIERRRPHWFASSDPESKSQAWLPHSSPSAGGASSASSHQ